MHRSAAPVIAIFAISVIVLIASTSHRSPLVSAGIDGVRASSFAILARDALTGEYGVAAASHAPLIGMNLEFLDYEAGAVVVLGGPFIDLNERTLTALRAGLAPARATAVGLAADDDKESRQVMVLAATGSAAFTGEELPDYAGHRLGDTYLVAGNRLVGEEVLEKMESGFKEQEGEPLADRLMAALEAGNLAGGEEGGTHSAALLVVGPGNPFATRDRLIDLRIDFVSEDAVAALARLRAQVDSVYGTVK